MMQMTNWTQLGRGLLCSAAFLVWLAAPAVAQEAALSEEEQKRKAEVEAADVHNLRSGKTITDRTDTFLEVPERFADPASRDFEVAKTAPEIEFTVIQGLEPEFFPAGEETGLWSIWGQSVYAPQTKRYYTSVGDHRAEHAQAYLIEFDPETREQRVAMDVNEFLGRKHDMTRDGKVHGWLRVMDNGDLYFATYNARWPDLLPKDFESGYDGGHLIKYNVVTREAEDLGVPLLHRSWPFHSMDTRRGIFVAAGLYFEFYCHDVINNKTLWAGYCPPGIMWENRCVLADEETGKFFTTNYGDPNKTQPEFVSFDPATGEFERLPCRVPEYPLPREGYEYLPRENQNVRCHTPERSADGAYYCMTYSGVLFKFWPDEEKTEFVAMNWGNGRYCGSVSSSPGGRYLYYLPGSHGQASFDDVPVLQFDTLTGSKKVLAFLGPHFRQEYNYTLGGTFSCLTSPDGEYLMIAINGRFEHDMKGGYGAFGTPAFLRINIPASERRD